jgi:hypothetical protein
LTAVGRAVSRGIFILGQQGGILQHRLGGRAGLLLSLNYGKVTVIEFFDYQCVYCSRLAPVMEQVIKAHPQTRGIFILGQQGGILQHRLGGRAGLLLSLNLLQFLALPGRPPGSSPAGKPETAANSG